MEPDYTIIDTAWGDHEVEIQIRRDSEEFKAAAKALSDFMNTLNLPADKHNRLVDLTVAQVEAAEHSAYEQGFMLGFECGENQKGD